MQYYKRSINKEYPTTMSSSPIISVRNMGKKYHLGFTHGGKGYKTLRDSITNGLRGILKGGKGLTREERLSLRKNSSTAVPKTPSAEVSPNEFWALKDISFEVNQGEVLGIIGANGAGKSTLLKILSEITEPTEGEIHIKGRIASLLEVGTGFHPELSGRENIFMNGAILGMTKSEIQAKFDEIVAFAEVERFIDTPVKRYSSGMYVRLAFAVATQLEPEILLIDEVLAVGDVAFQQKCLGKMKDVSTGGRTVIFVSHNMGAIRQLVDRCLLLKDGRIDFTGEPAESISRYVKGTQVERGCKRRFQENPPTNQCPVVIKEVTLKNEDGMNTDIFSVGGYWSLNVKLEALSKSITFQASIEILNENGISIYHLVCRDSGQEHFVSGIEPVLTITLPKLMLYPGQYTVNIALLYPGWSSIVFLKIESLISFFVDQSGGYEVVRPLGKGMAVVHEKAIWEIHSLLKKQQET